MSRKSFIQNLSHWGDVAAIPFFALLVYYFSMIEIKTPLENILMLFCLSAFILDVYFTAQFFRKQRRM